MFVTYEKNEFQMKPWAPTGEGKRGQNSMFFDFLNENSMFLGIF